MKILHLREEVALIVLLLLLRSSNSLTTTEVTETSEEVPEIVVRRVVPRDGIVEQFTQATVICDTDIHDIVYETLENQSKHDVSILHITTSNSRLYFISY